ncbi:protein-L-isoaspartate O-methyltransferase [Rhizobium sp. BK376]|uniref:protein-L-isoaspartate O-methyltransferase family protein n=1 Tax=Rhizobium sp. BK376 TaxID=2512149 RepID=UPI001049F15A|nr:protein-L-isoaspartate O-methyltransferase [Rhizobium sp. BK376]TCR91039.1 protein-L-isoaspartate(D-aspartate) O-methyltransferase [Rhizobium sp. BK376]
MPATGRATLDEIRHFYARLMAAASKSADPRLERIFEIVPREAFLPPGPWHIMVGSQYFETPSADPIYLYQNALVALDVGKGINNGEPFLHAAWIGAVAPQSGETVTHIGAGAGYYTALLSMLVLPNGHVYGFEREDGLANRARDNLVPFEGVDIIQADATIQPLPPSDVIYVNAGVARPPLSWLKALRPGGRMIFPWRPADDIGLAMLVTRTDAGFRAKPLMPSWFIPCVGASSTDECVRTPNGRDARRVRSLWPTESRAPDDSAMAVYRDVWFSSDELDY